MHSLSLVASATLPLSDFRLPLFCFCDAIAAMHASHLLLLAIPLMSALQPRGSLAGQGALHFHHQAGLSLAGRALRGGQAPTAKGGTKVGEDIAVAGGEDSGDDASLKTVQDLAARKRERPRDEDDGNAAAESRMSSSDLEAKYLLSNAGEDEYVLSSLPDQANADFQPSSDGPALAENMANSGDDADQGNMGSQGGAENLPELHAEEWSEDKQTDGGGGEAEDKKQTDGSGGGAALMACGSEIEALNQKLRNASSAGDVDMIHELVGRGALPNCVEPEQRGQEYCHVAWRPVHLAAKAGHSAAIHALVRLGADFSLPAGTGETVLHLAALGGHSDVVSMLLTSAPYAQTFKVDDAGCGNASAMMGAVAAGHVDTARLLLRLGADVNYTDLWSTSALHVAGMHGRADAVHVLCEAGASVDEGDWGGRSALHVAAEYGETATCEALLDHGASLEEQAENGFNALEWAKWRDQRETARFLRRAMGLDAEDSLSDQASAEVLGIGVADGGVAGDDAAARGGVKAVARRGKRQQGRGAAELQISRNLKEIVPLLRRRSAAGATEGNRTVVQSGKRKGLVLYSNAAGKLTSGSADPGFAIGRPSNAGVCHLKIKQCRAQDCTRTAYFGHPDDGMRRFCFLHRRRGVDVDLVEKGPVVPKWGGALPMPWQV